jgi:mRNA-degrading endonuclease toxin of MazEF toxin-antitoxin module
MPQANPGEVWIVDLGLAAKVRPGLILSDYPEDNELSLVIIVPHTTAVRGNRWEVSIPKTFLKTGGVPSSAAPGSPDRAPSTKDRKPDRRGTPTHSIQTG